MRSLLATSAFAVLLASGAMADDQAIALVKTVEGSAHALRAGQRVDLSLGAPVYAQDVVETSEGTVGLTFKDGTRVSLGPNSQLECKDFAYAPAEDRLSFLVRLLRGTMMFTSGSLTKLAPDAVRIETPVASVAVRGTTFLAKIERD